MQDLLEYIAKAIVDNPDAVVINKDENDGLINLSISVAPQDMGKIIGKQGKIIKAIRKICTIRAIKENKKIDIALTEQS